MHHLEARSPAIQDHRLREPARSRYRGTKPFGGSKWGVAGASGGALAGMFISLPALIVGTVLGAMAAEKVGAKRPDREALRSGAGAAVGFLLGTFARLGCALVMIGIYVLAVWPAKT